MILLELQKRNSFWTQKQQKWICESNQVLEFHRRSSLNVVLINPVPHVFQCPFSMLRCAVAVRTSEVDLYRVPAEISADSLCHRLCFIFQLSIPIRMPQQKVTKWKKSVINLVFSLSVFTHLRAPSGNKTTLSFQPPSICHIKPFQLWGCFRSDVEWVLSMVLNHQPHKVWSNLNHWS